MAGSGRPESKQVKVIGDGGVQNVPYFNQQTGPAPSGSTVQHPLAPVKIVSDEQQQLQDASGA